MSKKKTHSRRRERHRFFFGNIVDCSSNSLVAKNHGWVKVRVKLNFSIPISSCKTVQIFGPFSFFLFMIPAVAYLSIPRIRSEMPRTRGRPGGKDSRRYGIYDRIQ